MTTIVQSAMTAVVPVPDLSSVETQLAVQNLRSVINNNSSYIRAVDGVADEFADATGVDATASLNETYDASGDYYHNRGTPSAELIPTMTSDTAPSGVASASSTINPAWHAFNDASGDSNKWAGPVSGGWGQYDFGASNSNTRCKMLIAIMRLQ